MPERPIELSNSKADLDRFSTAHSSRLIVARVDISSKDEEGGMDLKQRTSLKGLLANKNKGSASKDVPKTQVPLSHPPHPLPMTAVGLLSNLDLKRKRKVQEVEEGEVIPPKGARHPPRRVLRVAPLLPRDMEGLRHTKQLDLFMSLKRDLTMVS